MTIDVSPVPREESLALRDLYRKEMDCQIILDSWHGRGWTDSYLLRLDGLIVGYGLVGGVRDELVERVRRDGLRAERLVRPARTDQFVEGFQAADTSCEASVVAKPQPRGGMRRCSCGD